MNTIATISYDEAKKQGLSFTGISYDTEIHNNSEYKKNWEKILCLAEELKKLYNNVEYEIAYNVPVSHFHQSAKIGLMGNKLFFELLDEYRFNTMQNKINNYDWNKQQLLSDYEDDLKELDREYTNAIEKLNYFKKFLKNS